MVESILTNQPNELLAEKLLDASYMLQRAHAQNMSNWLVPGAKKVGLESNFEAQLKALVEQGNFGKLSELKPGLEEKEGPIEYEKTLRDMRSTMMDSQFLGQTISSNFQQIETAITGQ